MIREYESGKDKKIPIVALTAKTIPWEHGVPGISDMDDYLMKPIEMNRLEKIFERYLPVSENKEEMEISSDGRNGGFYSLRGVAEELKIPVNVLENILIDFFDDAIEVIDSLKTAERENNFVDIMKLSHRLKGAAYNLRLNSLGDILEIIEEKSNKKEDADYKAMINSAENEIMLYKNYIQ
jgi:CheY-like chemotaxis protein